MGGAACVLVPLTWSSSQVWRDGEALLTHSLERHPTSQAVFSALGDHHVRTGDEEAALAAFSEAVRHAKSRGARAQNLSQIGTIHGKAGRVAESMAALSQALELDPGRSSAMVGMGNNEWARGNASDAARWYERALAADGTSYVAAVNLAMALEKLGDSNGAARYRSLAKRLRPKGSAPQR
jgi:Flp pilus assembly protein TadD